MGYEKSSSSNTVVLSLIGEPFVGKSGEGDVRIESGFLAIYKLNHGISAVIDNIPDYCMLFQNFPNPFNPETTIAYQILRESDVNLKIYNIRGQLIRTLVDQKQPAGVYTVKWDAKNNSGQTVSTGVYFYWLKTNDYSKVRKLTLLR